MINLLVKLIPVLLITNSLFMAGWVSNFLKVQTLSAHSNTQVLAVTSSPTPFPKPAASSIPTSSPKPTPTPTPEVKTVITNNYITVVATPTPSPSPTPIPTPTPTPIPASTINMEIKTTESDQNFSVQIEDGINACDALSKAKNQGKISSLTLDDSYLATFHTLLVSEINGFSNYWVFTVNGQSPDGCSLINLHNNDSVIWELVNGGN